MFLRNADTHLEVHTSSHARRPSTTPFSTLYCHRYKFLVSLMNAIYTVHHNAADLFTLQYIQRVFHFCLFQYIQPSISGDCLLNPQFENIPHYHNKGPGKPEIKHRCVLKFHKRKYMVPHIRTECYKICLSHMLEKLPQYSIMMFLTYNHDMSL
jgi:hypothetical protein